MMFRTEHEQGPEGEVVGEAVGVVVGVFVASEAAEPVFELVRVKEFDPG